MRKKVMFLLCSLLMVITVCFVMGKEVCAEVAEDGLYEYEISDGIATITKYNGETSDIVVPSTIGEYQVKAIGGNAFSNCTGIESVVIPEGIESIGESAFYNCKNLRSVQLPKTLTEIKEAAFHNCENLKDINLENELKEMGPRVFHGAGLAHVDWPESLPTIPGGTFWSCSYLKSVHLPDTVTKIGSQTFSECFMLADINLPESLISILDDAFRNCSITSITIPENVQEITNNIFYGCDNLREINVSKENSNYLSQKGVLFDKNTKTLLSYPMGKTDVVYTIPQGVENIFTHAFATIGGNLKTVELPASIKAIGMYAFVDTSVQTLKFFTNSFTVSAENPNVAQYSIDENIIIYGYQESSAETYAQKYGRSFVLLNQNDKLTYPSVFGEKEQSPGDNPSTQQPSGNSNAGANTGDGTNVNKNQQSSRPAAGTILNDAKSSYTVVTAGTAVEYKAPTNKKVKKVTIPSSVTINGITYKVTSIAPNAFKKCKKLKKITIGAGVTEIGKNAFAGCKNLKNVIVKSKALKKVGKNAFKGINKTAKIKVPKKQLKKYQKLLKKAKLAKSIKIIK